VIKATRDSYSLSVAELYKRGGSFSAIIGRLAEVAANQKENFNKVLGKLIYPVPDWIIDRSDAGPQYIKVRTPNGHSHSSEGAGEGLLSLLCITDALYDSNPDELIAIDEPELSLHPAVLRRLDATLGEYSKDRQIVIATHSPYFANPEFIANGATLCRVFLDERGSTLAQLKPSTATQLRSFLENKNNPHVLGLDAREIFFQNDRVILVEGQEDVVFYPDIEKELGLEFEGNFFGWGVGGADNMGIFASFLENLGFAKVVGILDRDKEELAKRLEKDFPAYRFLTIPADDVRTKDARSATSEKIGLLKEGKLLDEFKEATRLVIETVNEYLRQ
jgi:predicted ATP-dependent endonuclease of OLD family